MAIKGSTGEGQPTFFGNTLKSYIEETSAAVNIQSSNQIAELSSLLTADLGQGGQDTVVTPGPVNDNSLVAHSPTSTDYIEATGFIRNQVTEYTVQPGDLLSFIASDYGVSMNSIIWTNNLKSADSLSPGQILRIPPVSGVIHKVKNGDTVALVAKKYNAEERKILEFNGLTENSILDEGEEIIVPDGQMKIQVVSNNIPTPKYGTSKANVNQRFSYLPDLGDYFMIPTAGYDWGKIHGRNGVDIANSCGTAVYAAAEGTVAIADASGYNGGFGKYVKLIHPNGTETLYAHATKLLVVAGDYVQRGQQITVMGSTGRSTGCHLHFEVHGAKNPLAK